MMSNHTRQQPQRTMADLAQAIEEGHIASHLDAGMYVFSHRTLRHWIGRDQQPPTVYRSRRRPARQRPAS